MTTLESITITTKEQADLLLTAGVIPEHDRQTVIDDWGLAPLGEFSFMIRGGGFIPLDEGDLGLDQGPLEGTNHRELSASALKAIVNKYENPENFVHEMYLLDFPCEYTVFHNGKVVNWTLPESGILET